MEKVRVNRRFKSFVAVLFVLALLFSFLMIPSVSAYNIIGKKMIGGIRNRYFWFDYSLTTQWKPPFYNAINRWNNTSTYHAFGETSKRNNSQLDFYIYSSAYDNANGYATFFRTTNVMVIPALEDWKFCEVKLNVFHLPKESDDFRAGVACHEIGHTIGLGENNTNPYSVMCQAYYGRLVTYSGADDVNGTNYLYPNGY